MILKMSSGKWRPFCLGLNVLKHWGRAKHICVSKLGHHWFKLRLLYIMACNLFGTKPSQNPRWFVINWTLRNKLQWNSNQISLSFIQNKIRLKHSSALRDPFYPASVCHYNDVIMTAVASQITSPTIVCSAVYSGTDERKHQSSASLAFVWGIHRWPVNSPHKWPVTRKMFPFDDVIMSNVSAGAWAPFHELFMRSLFKPCINTCFSVMDNNDEVS